MRRESFQVVATIAILVFVMLVLVSGFDRISETRHSFVRFVPQDMQVGAAKRLAAKALSEGKYSAAAEHATVAITHDPQDPRGLSFLGSSQILLGEGGSADATLAVAERISRRDPMAQIHFFSRELDRGDFAAAVGRLDAVLRTARGNAITQDMLAQLEASQQGREALVQRLSSSPRWAQVYLEDSAASSDRLRSRAQILGQRGSGIAALGCDATLAMIRELARRNFRAEAELVAAGHCSAATPAGLIADPDFENFGAETPAAAIGWRRFRTGDLRVTRLSAGEARVEVDNRASVTRLVMAQPVMLEAGAYVVKAKVDGPGGQRLIAALGCTTPSRPRPGRQRLDREGQRLEAPDCDDAVLSLWLRPGKERVVIDRITMAKAN